MRVEQPTDYVRQKRTNFLAPGRPEWERNLPMASPRVPPKPTYRIVLEPGTHIPDWWPSHPQHPSTFPKTLSGRERLAPSKARALLTERADLALSGFSVFSPLGDVPPVGRPGFRHPEPPSRPRTAFNGADFRTWTTTASSDFKADNTVLGANFRPATAPLQW